MPEGSYHYCDVSLPVPLDQPFTYALPETLRHRVRPGSRILVPFVPRKLTGVILRCHDDPPEMTAREAMRLIDAEPVLDAELLALGRWIAGYYCAPLCDVDRLVDVTHMVLLDDSLVSGVADVRVRMGEEIERPRDHRQHGNRRVRKNHAA